MSNSSARRAAFDRVAGGRRLLALSAHERHLQFVHDYARFYGNGKLPVQHDAAGQVQGTDLSALQAGHRFIRSTQDDADASWEAKLALRYYQKLFKEYCIADLSRYKESKLGLRWRTEKEVVAGKGQFICGAKGCDEKAGLCSYEVNFAYMEAGEKKQALVKLRVCPSCALKLNYGRESQYKKAGPGGSSGGRKRSASADREEPSERSNKRANLEAAAEVLARCLAGEGSSKDAVAPPLARAAEAAQQQLAAAEAQAQASVLPADDSMWEAKPAQETATAEENFDEYFEGLFA